MANDRFENLSEGLKAKARECKTPEEIQKLAKSEGLELSLDELDDAAGGAWSDDCDDYCPIRDCGNY